MVIFKMLVNIIRANYISSSMYLWTFLQHLKNMLYIYAYIN